LASKIPLLIHPVTEKQALLVSTSLSLMILLAKDTEEIFLAYDIILQVLNPLSRFFQKRFYEQ
jgi:hypothetical protein